MSAEGTVRMIDIALAQVAAAMAVSDHLGTIIPEIAAMEAENKRLRADLAHCERASTEQAATIATLRAALDGLVEAGRSYIDAVDADLYREGTPEDWWEREATLAALRAALATAKETP